tara:strand:+ start:83108 stop:83911 length:804 start_codon:yes stop_codon:yes gene_type:complete
MKNIKSLFAISLVVASVGLKTYAHGSVRKIFTSQMTFPFENHSKKLYGVDKRTIYLTFDDGPTSAATPEILEILRDYGIKATFFVVGRMARNNPALVARIREEGHRLGNHSYSHEFDFPTESHFISSLKGTHNQIKNYVYRHDLLLFRAPGGIWNNWRTQIGNSDPSLRRYVGPIYWNVGGGNPNNRDDADWKCWTKGVSVSQCEKSYLNQIYSNYRRGYASIVLMHDINRKSAQMLAQLLRDLSRDRVQWNFELIEDIPAVQEMAF